MTDFVQTPSYKLAAYIKGDPSADKLALVLPGRLDTKDYAHMTSHVNFLARKGYYAVSIDPPFSWESPGDISNYTTTNYLKAVNELIDQIDKPTLLLGHSRGGAVSILASDNSHVKAIVPVMATYGAPSAPSQEDLKRNMHISTRDLPPGDRKTDEQKEFRLSLSYFDDGAKYDPQAQLKAFKGPKLLICAARDIFTPPQTVREVFESLNEPKSFLELDTEHDYRLHPGMIEAVNKAVEEFISKNSL